MELGQALRALVAQLDRTQWQPAHVLVSSQLRHLVLLAEHCCRHSPYFAERLQRAGVTPADLGRPDGLAQLPVMTRRELQAAGADAFCRQVPSGHGRISESHTSGSTGEPVFVRRTWVNGVFWNAIAMRELQWHARDLTGRLCTISPLTDAYTRYEDWGPPATLFGRTGPMLSLPIAADVARLVEWVAAFRATFLLIFPSTLDAFTVYCRRYEVSLPDLQHVLTVGETLAPSIRAEAETVFGARVADCYSSEECGYMALSCPESGLYHVMSENVIAEVLNDRGEACRPGETGRVTVTALHNYATPFVRYSVGDMAHVADPCPCGRGLPTWTRIVGRERNLVLMPDGTRAWPITGFPRCRDVAPVRQYQLIQEDRETIQARLVVERPLVASEEASLRALFHRSIGHPFHIEFSYYRDRLPTGPSGKFEEFVCRLRL
jgi:phenylacetate-CoA ligase